MSLSYKNKKFWAMPKYKQRMAIARDVLKQLELRKIKARKGIYFSIFFDYVLPDVGDKFIDKIYRENSYICNVCNIGALFLGLVNCGNNLTFNDVVNIPKDARSVGIGGTSMKDHLKKIFSPLQLTLIESAFENTYSHTDGTPKSGRRSLSYYSAIVYGRKYYTPKDKMIAIMRNIYRNKGTFIP